MSWVHLFGFLSYGAWAALAIYFSGKGVKPSNWEVVLLASMLSVNAFIDFMLALAGK